MVKRKPPEHNYVHWDQNTLTRLMSAPPEPLVSRFHVSHGMLLNVLSRRGDGARAMRQLIRDSHEPESAKPAHRRRGWQLFRGLVTRGIVEFVPRTPEGARVRVNVDLQDDFSMNQALSLYLIETLPLLDPDAPTHALDVLTLVESILENPELILRRQLDRIKDRAVAQMKADGVEYEQRMEELDKLEYPKPLRDFVYDTFNAFADRHPWVGEENIRPKSIAREMFETWKSFEEYVLEYDLERSEGLLLRHLSSVYKVLSQTVPDGAKTDDVLEIEWYVKTLVRGVDASLADEWERMRDPGYTPLAASSRSGLDTRPPQIVPYDITADTRAFTAAIRTRIFSVLKAWSRGDGMAALAGMEAPAEADDAAEPWTADRLRATLETYLADHQALRFDPEARNTKHTHIEAGAGQPLLARATDAGRSGDGQRLGRRVRGGRRRLAREAGAGHVAPSHRPVRRRQIAPGASRRSAEDRLSKAQIARAQPLECGAVGPDNVGIERLGGGDQPGIVLTQAARRPPLQQRTPPGLGQVHALEREPLERRHGGGLVGCTFGSLPP